MSWHNLANSELFSEAANDFRRNGGIYCKAPRGSIDYTQYWDEQRRRCMLGYSVAGTWITGRNYFYLNFFPMWKVDDSIALEAFNERRNGRGKISKRTADKILEFPRFTEMQFEWWRFKHIAWNGGTFMGINSPGGKHICCAKARGAGFSYMEASDGVYNYNFIDGSKSYFCASIEQYLTTDGILNKSHAGLEWINDKIPAWKQNRQKKNTLMYDRASYVDSFGVEKGTMSEIIGVIVDNPNKTRGKRGKKITFEEAGSFPNLKKAAEVALGSLRDGDLYVGQMSVFGTGGEEGPSIEGLQDMFYEPDAWDMLAFPNVWDNSSDTCGYFVPSYRANFAYYDKDGNCDMEGALASDNEVREQKAKSKDPRVLDARKAEYPQEPNEAFQRLIGNGFNTNLIDKQIRKVETSAAIQELIRYGRLKRSKSIFSVGGVEFEILSKEQARPLSFPHNASNEDADLSGCVTVYEKPYTVNGIVPDGMYEVVFDPYYKDDAIDRTSAFAIFVFKLDNIHSQSFVRLPVANYVGRPMSLRTCYENLFMLCDYYNAKAQGEIAGGGQGVIDYARIHKMLDRLEFEPTILTTKENALSGRNQSFLMNMPTERKQLGMSYMVDWHVEDRGINAEGEVIINLDMIYDVPLLKEMKAAGARNVDRVSACLIAMFMIKEKIATHIEAKTEKNGFYDRELFGSQAGQSSSETISLY